MKRFIIVLIILVSVCAYSIDLVVTDYYDSTFGDYIPSSSNSIDYSKGGFYAVSNLGIVANGDKVVLHVFFPDGNEESFEEQCDFDGEAIFFKKINFKGVGSYSVELEFKGETSRISFTVEPDNTEDPFEPNNYEDNVFFLERGTVISSLTSQNDVDYYKLKVDAMTDIEISVNSDVDLSLSVYKDGALVVDSDNYFNGDEDLAISGEPGIYTVKVYSPVKEIGVYNLTVKGNFPVYLPLTDFNRGFDKRIVVSNLSNQEGDAGLYWYDGEGNEVFYSNEHFLPFETKTFDGGDYAYLKIYPSSIEVNASAYGINNNNDEAIGYEGKLLQTENTIVSHVATQTDIYETFAYFSFEEASSYLKYGDETLAEGILSNSSFLINFNDYYNNEIVSPWGMVSGDGAFAGIEMFRFIGGDYHQATALTLTPQLARAFFLPHIDVRYFWWTGISIVNPNQLDAKVEIKALNSNGEIVAESSFTIEPYGKSVGIVSDYFENGLPENAAALKIVSTLPVQGLYLFGTKRGDDVTEDIFGGLNSSAIYSRTLYFPFMPSDEERWTGIGMFNPNNETVSVNIKGLNTNGEIMEGKTLELAPLQKYVSLKKDLFNNSDVLMMVVFSDKPVCGFYLFGDKNHTYLYGLEAMR